MRSSFYISLFLWCVLTYCAQLLLKVRELLLELRPLPNARHGAAADVLLLLAHTKTFAIPTTYATVRGDPVQVGVRLSLILSVWVKGGWILERFIFLFWEICGVLMVGGFAIHAAVLYEVDEVLTVTLDNKPTFLS